MGEKDQAAGGLGPFRLKRLLRTARYIDTRVGVPADQDEDARLWDLVAEVARVIGVAAPEALVLTPDPEAGVAKAEGGGLALYIGAPLLLAMPVLEVKAVVAHALAVMREPHPELAAALVRARAKAEAFVELGGEDSWLDRLYRRVLEDSAGFHADLERHADRAAAVVAGSREQALAAMVRAQAIAEHFELYAECYLIRAMAVDPPPLADLFTEWLSLAARPVPDWAVGSVPLPRLATRTAFHPGLRTSGSGDDLKRARRAANPLVPASCEPLVSDLADDIADALASFIDVDEDADYDIGHAEAGQAVTAAAGRLLGRDARPADVVDLVGEGRGAELAAAWFKILPDNRAACFLAEQIQAARREPASTLGDALQVFLIAVAVEHGYGFDAVLRPGELMADGRTPIKTHAVISQAVAGDADPLARLVAQLSEGV